MRSNSKYSNQDLHYNLFDNLIEGCQIIGPDWRYIYINDAALKHGRHTKEELLGKTMTGAYPGIETTEMFSQIRRCMEERTSCQMENEFTFPDGSKGWYELRIQPVPEGVFVMSIDITERKKAEQKLKLWQDIFENVTFGFVIGTPESKDLGTMNPAFSSMHGYTMDELTGTPIADVFAPDERAGLPEHIRQAHEKGHHAWESKHLRKDGTVFPVTIDAVTVKDKNGTILYRIVSVQDITERKKVEEALRDNEERMRLFIEHAPAAIAMFDRNMCYIEASHRWRSDYGLGSKEIIGRSHYEIFPEIGQDLKAVHRRGLAGEIVKGENYNFERPDGSVQYVRWEMYPWCDSAGKIGGIIIFTEDITERKKAQEALQHSEAEFRAMFEVASIGMAQAHPQSGQWLRVNHKLCEITGYSEAELLGLRFSDITHPDDRDSDWESFKAVVGGQQPDYRMEKRYIRKDGSIAWVNVNMTVIRDEAGQVLRSLATIEDIAERRRAEEALRNREEQFRLISENVADMIAVLDLEGKLVYASPAFHTVLADEKLTAGTDVFQLIYPEDRDNTMKAFGEIVRTGVNQETEFRLIAKDGSIRILESLGSVIRDNNGTVFQIVTVSRDITEKKQLEKQAFRSQRMESIGTLAGGIAHDLNNVFTPIMLSYEMLSQKITDESAQKTLQVLQATVQRGADLVKQVLSFARGVEGTRSAVQVRHVIREIERIINETFPRSIQLKLEVPKNLPTVSADPTQLHQVLMNLCVNARDAMPDGGVLEIFAEKILIDEQYARMRNITKLGLYVGITVTDNGTGMPPDIIDRIFEPFYTTKEIGKGTGLGLSTVLAIVKSHNGFINVYSELGKGTAFKVYLPAEQGEAAENIEKREIAPAGNGELILIVEDEVSIREITKTTLEAYGYSVITAKDGTDAVAEYANYGANVALVLTDMMMPVMDGASMIRILKKMNPKTKYVIVSGLKQDDLKLGEEGIVFLQKPYTADKLLCTVHEALARK